MSRRFAVVRLSALGDLVLVSPALEYLSRKGEVMLITYPAFSSLYDGDPRVSRVLTLPRRARIGEITEVAREVKEWGAEVLFDLQVKPLTFLLSLTLRRAGVPTVRTYKRSLRRRLHAWLGLPLPYEYVPQLHLKAIARYFGESPPTIRPRLYAPTRKGFRTPYVVIAPEASSPLKEWDFSRFHALARRLKEMGYRVVWVGKRGKPPVSVGEDLRGKTDLKALVEVIAGAKVLIGNDSAAVHMAHALGVRVVVIMGPTTVSFGFIPKDPSVRVAERPLKCRPCSTNGSGRCMVGGRPCMGVDVDEVLSLVI